MRLIVNEFGGRREGNAVNRAERERRNKRRESIRSKQRVPAVIAPPTEPVFESPDIELEHLLVSRGWVIADRAERYVVYDWLPSEPGDRLDYTHVFIDFNGRSDAPPYRLSLVDGERHMFTERNGIIANLEAIEARRCPDCGPIAPRLRSADTTCKREALSKHEASRRHGCRSQSSRTSKHQGVGSS
jgi:hypothetical protein